MATVAYGWFYWTEDLVVATSPASASAQVLLPPPGETQTWWLVRVRRVPHGSQANQGTWKFSDGDADDDIYIYMIFCQLQRISCPLWGRGKVLVLGLLVFQETWLFKLGSFQVDTNRKAPVQTFETRSGTILSRQCLKWPGEAFVRPRKSFARQLGRRSAVDSRKTYVFHRFPMFSFSF